MIYRKFVSKALISRLSPTALCQSAKLARRGTTIVMAMVFANASFATETTNDLNITAPAKTSACYLDGMSEQLQCGKISVPENPQKPDGKHIDIHFAILPAIKDTHPSEALLAIAGGPGQSAIEHAAGFDKLLSKVRQQRDILLIDQRGTGQSNILSCEDSEAISMLAFDDENIDVIAETEKCLMQIKADITQYGSETALTDFEAVRAYLGYQKLHLYGISYGTRMAQLYMRHYPEALATVTLDGVVPMQQSVLAIGGAIERGFELLMRDCANNTACHTQYPDLLADFITVNERLGKKAITQNVRDPQTNEPSTLLLTRSKFTGAIRMGLYAPAVRALLPHAIHQAAKQDYQAILGIYTLSADGLGLAIGMHSSVVCGEDIHRISDQMRKDAKESYISASMIEGLEKTCEVWKIPPVKDTFSEPIRSDLPTLLLSGELDPATPPNWGALAQAEMTNAKHLISPFATHGVAAQTCANDLIADLVDSGSVKNLDASCLQKDIRRSFYLNANSVEPLTMTTPSSAEDNVTATPVTENPISIVEDSTTSHVTDSVIDNSTDNATGADKE
ncbi:alpha/beta hydrolase [Shewanella sp. OMA3-2]|uniref:alpha/beta hydrolase n=1 Tax=Shewanella sp. OMA3-2 TaxID=2908650 RepID=UPI001F2986DA|nr:alpha/beta hydrolase [Shewanella sp. OMA3-2]UJF22311.1 alpha/beta hydrolase [Shewanella sp. OMA3-2]